MKTRTKVFLALGGLFLGAIAAEQVFLSRLQYVVTHDDARLSAFLTSLHYPIWVEPGFGFCRPGGSSWGYEYQFCVYSETSISCPLDSYMLQYLGPQTALSLLSKRYHNDELVFREPILVIDKNGKICNDLRSAK